MRGLVSPTTCDSARLIALEHPRTRPATQVSSDWIGRKHYKLPNFVRPSLSEDCIIFGSITRLRSSGNPARVPNL